VHGLIDWFVKIIAVVEWGGAYGFILEILSCDAVNS
jgi:hypothetical protein